MKRRRSPGNNLCWLESSSIVYLFSCINFCTAAIRCSASRNMYSSPSGPDDPGKSYLHYPTRSEQQPYRDGERSDNGPGPYTINRQQRDFDPLAYNDNQVLRVPARYNDSFSSRNTFRNSSFGSDPYQGDLDGFSGPGGFDGFPGRNTGYGRSDPDSGNQYSRTPNSYDNQDRYSDVRGSYNRGPYNDSRRYGNQDQYSDSRSGSNRGSYNDSSRYGDQNRYPDNRGGYNRGLYNNSSRYDNQNRYGPDFSDSYSRGPYNDDRDRYPDVRGRYSRGPYNDSRRDSDSNGYGSPYNDTGRYNDGYNSSYRRPDRVRGEDFDPDYRSSQNNNPGNGYNNNDNYGPSNRSSRLRGRDYDYSPDYPSNRSSQLRDPNYNNGRPDGRFDNQLGYDDRGYRDGYGNYSANRGGDRYRNPDRYPAGNYSNSGRDFYGNGPGSQRDGGYAQDYGRNRPDRNSCPIQTKETKSSHADVPTTSASAILSTPVGDFVLYCSPHPAKTILSYPLYCTGDDGMGKDAVHTIIEESCYDIRVVDDLYGDLLKPQHLVITLAKGAHSAAYQVDYESGSIRLLPCLHVFQYKYLTDVETVLTGDAGTLLAFANNNVDPAAEQHERYAPIYLTKNGEIALCGFAEITETTDVTSWKRQGDSVLLVYSQRRGQSRRYLLHFMEVRVRNGYCDVRRSKNQKTLGGAPYRGHQNTLCVSQPFTVDQCLCGVEDLQIVRGSQKDNIAHLAVGLSNNVKDENFVGCLDEEVLVAENGKDVGFCCCPWANQRSFIVAYSYITNSFDHLDRSPVAFQQLYGGPASVTGISQLQTEQCCPVFQTISPVGTTELYTLEYNGQGQLQVYLFIGHGLPSFVERSSYGYCEDNDIILSYTLHSFQAENTIYHIRCNRDGKYTFDSYKLHKDRYAKGGVATPTQRLSYTSGNSTNNRTSVPYQPSLAPFESQVPPLNRISALPGLPALQRSLRDNVVVYDGLAASPGLLSSNNRTSLYGPYPAPAPNYSPLNLGSPVQVTQYQETVSNVVAPYPYQQPPPVNPGYYSAPDFSYQTPPFYASVQQQNAPRIRYQESVNRTSGAFHDYGRYNRTSPYQNVYNKGSSYAPPVQYGPLSYGSSQPNSRYQDFSNLYR